MHVSRPYRVGIIAALALLCMAPNPAAARTSEKSPKTPEIAGDIAAVALPAAGLIVSLAVGDRQGVKQLGSGVRRRSGRRLRVEIRDRKSRPAGHEGRPSRPFTRRSPSPEHRTSNDATAGNSEPRPTRWPSMSAGAASEPARENTTFGTCSPERLWERAAVTCLRSPTANGGRRSPSFRSARSANASESAPPSCSESSKRKRANRTRSPGGTVPAFFYRAFPETDKPSWRTPENSDP